MNSVITILLSVLVLTFAVYRQFKPRPADRSSVLYVSLAVLVLGAVSGDVLDPGRLSLSIALLAVEVVTAVGLGVLRAMTVHLWADADGDVWAKGTAWTLLAWAGSIAVRVGGHFAATAMGLTPATSGIAIFIGLTLAAQSLVMSSRARALAGSRTRSYTVER